MKRVCFDIASNYFWDGRQGWLNTPEQARINFSDTAFKFHGATAIIQETRQSLDFVDYRELYKLLDGSDEIITFNGRTCDLIVLERLVETKDFSSIWRKPHHDLRGWRGFSLRESVRNVLPSTSKDFDLLQALRRTDPKFASTNDFTSDNLAGTYRDAKFTMDLFEVYLQSGSHQYTFRDLQ